MEFLNKNHTYWCTVRRAFNSPHHIHHHGCSFQSTAFVNVPPQKFYVTNFFGSFLAINEAQIPLKPKKKHFPTLYDIRIGDRLKTDTWIIFEHLIGITGSHNSSKNYGFFLFLILESNQY